MSLCVIDEKTKYYLIPTKKWLKPIEPLIIDDSNTSGLLMISELIAKEKIIVKITIGNNKKIRIIGKKLNNIYNFSKIYYSFTCFENYEKITNEYKNEKQFCEIDGNKLITIEIMKKYSGSLTKLLSSLSSYQTTKILIQILYSLMEGFYRYGFVHEDMSLGNVLYRIKSTNEIIEYNLTDKKKVYENLNIGEIIPMISDYDKSESYKKDIYQKYSNTPIEKKIKGYLNTLTLLDSISKISQSILLLIKKNKEQEMIKAKIFDLFSSDDYETYYRHTYKSLRDYLLNLKTFEEMIHETYLIYEELINKIIQIYKNDSKFKLIPQNIDNF